MRKIYDFYTNNGWVLIVGAVLLMMGLDYYNRHKMMFDTFEYKNGVSTYETVVGSDTIEVINGYPLKK